MEGPIPASQGGPKEEREAVAPFLQPPAQELESGEKPEKKQVHALMSSSDTSSQLPLPRQRGYLEIWGIFQVTFKPTLLGLNSGSFPVLDMSPGEGPCLAKDPSKGPVSEPGG